MYYEYFDYTSPSSTGCGCLMKGGRGILMPVITTIQVLPLSCPCSVQPQQTKLAMTHSLLMLFTTNFAHYNPKAVAEQTQITHLTHLHVLVGSRY